MKHLLLSLLLFPLFTACGVTSSGNIDDLRIGMSPEQVAHLLGRPQYRAETRDSSRWGYVLGGVLSADTHLDIRFKDRKVVAFDLLAMPEWRMRLDGGTLRGGVADLDRRTRELDLAGDGEFRALYTQVKGSSDAWITDVLKRELRYRRLTAQQCRLLLEQYAFDDARMTGLTLLAPHIIDRQNDRELLEAFTFLTNRPKAEEILRAYR